MRLRYDTALFVSAAALFGLSDHIHAASVVWSSVKQVTGISNVIAGGNGLSVAYGQGGATVNGVTFAEGSLAGNTQNGLTVSLGGFSNIDRLNFTTNLNDTPNINGRVPGSMNELLRGGAFNGGASASVTLSGLTVGRQYTVQFFVADYRNETGAWGALFPRFQTITSGNTTGQLGYLNNSTGPASYVVGTFTADAGSQVFTLAPNQSAQINAIAVVPEPTQPPATGSITRHVWTGVGGGTVANLTGLATYPNSPSSTGTLTSFQAPTNFGDNYGTRVFGWVHAPVTGNYTFSISGDDNCELWLGTNSSPDSRRLIASAPDWTDPLQWTRFPEQTSVSIPLVAGRYYFIEALHKESGGGDNLGVGWSYPGQSLTVIPGSRLSPWQILAPEPQPDVTTIGVGDTVGIPVLSNDIDPNGAADLVPSTLEIVTPPARGVATVDAANRLIRYTHNAAGTTPDSFTYRIRDTAGMPATATVAINLSSAARLPMPHANMPASPPPQSLSLVNAFPSLSFTQPLCITTPPGETNRLFILEKTGDIVVVPSLSAPTRGVFLDLDALVNSRTSAPAEVFQTSSEQGLLGLAFHPNYATNRRFFVVYSLTVGGTRVQRLSEFTTSPTNPNSALTNSERVLIQQVNEADNHNGGDLHFGPDGYLYMSWGDEGGANDFYNNSQLIDRDFWSSITRIDVDLEAPDLTPAGTGPGDDANLRPNTHPAVVLDAGGYPRYEVPADNPWIGATSFLGRAVTPANVRTEFWAVGLRNPWRMSFDPVTGLLWCADVGDGAREEVNRIVRGGNYEWAYREGSITGPKWGSRPSGWTGSHPPIYDYTRGSGPLQGMSVIGGIVYRGSRIPALAGRYIFADYVSGNIWSLDDSVSPPAVERITGEGGISGIGRDPSNGDVLFADLDNGVIHRLVAQTVTTGFPATLADTGLFADPVALTPNPGLIAYDINLPFWSDHAKKRRWFGMPDTNPVAGFSRDGNWSLPAGTIWVKHFDLETTRGNPATSRRLETRVLVRNSTGSYGVSYRWNPAGTVATLVDAAGEDFDITVTEGGTPRTQRWRIPSQSDCRTCHSPQAGHALSFRTRQLNHDGQIAGVSGNFIRRLAETGYLTGLDVPDSELPRHVAPSETSYSLEARARSYLAVNCAYCHSSGGTVPAAWDVSAHLKLFDTGIVNGTSPSGLHPDDRLCVPGNDERSILVNRAAARNGYTRMPPIATSEVDSVGVQLLIDWIRDELPDRQSYPQWRTARFGSSSSPQSEPTFDADLDGRTNMAEFLAGTDPLKADTVPAPAIATSGSQVSFSMSAPPGRGVRIQTSADLFSWSNWSAVGNDGISAPPGSLLQLSAPQAEPSAFFRAVFTEE